MAKAGKRTGGAKGRSLAVASPQDVHALLKAFSSWMEAGGDLHDATDIERAQDKAFDAMQARSRRKRIALAEEALAISPLCADAYAILAESAATPNEALALQRKAVEAGAAALGEDVFKNDVGDFWGVLETRPYMRARHELALSLWDRGDRDEAVEHFRDMLRLNPNDNQGIRYCLFDALLALGRDDEADKLAKRYKHDDTAAWAWSKALLSFRQKGNGAASRKVLARAVDTNGHVASYLVGEKQLPRRLPEYFSDGDEDEAACYVSGARAAWDAAEGARAWVRTVLAGEPRGTDK